MKQKKKNLHGPNDLSCPIGATVKYFSITSGVANSSKIEFTLFLDRHFNDCVELKIENYGFHLQTVNKILASL